MTVATTEGRWTATTGGFGRCSVCRAFLVATPDAPVWMFWPDDVSGVSTMTVCATCADAGEEDA